MVYDPFSYLFNLLWFLFIFFVVVSPFWRRMALERAREGLIDRLRKRRGSKVIAMIHRQEQLGFLGFPIFRYISIEDSERVLRAIRTTPPDVPIDFIIHTPGGLALAASQIANALVKHKAPVRVIVPHFAMSGGTLIALASDEIIMDENAVLGPVDPQLGNSPAASILRAVERKGEKEVDDNTLIMADVAEKAIKQMVDYVTWLLTQKGWDLDRAKRVAEELATGKYTHDYPLTVEKLRELGLKVSTNVPEEVYELMELYEHPTTGVRVPSVLTLIKDTTSSR